MRNLPFATERSRRRRRCNGYTFRVQQAQLVLAHVVELFHRNFSTKKKEFPKQKERQDVKLQRTTTS